MRIDGLIRRTHQAGRRESGGQNNHCSCGMLACATDLSACGNELSTAFWSPGTNCWRPLLATPRMPSKHAAGKPRSAATCGDAARPRPLSSAASKFRSWYRLHSWLLRGVAKLEHALRSGFCQRHHNRGQVKRRGLEPSFGRRVANTCSYPAQVSIRHWLRLAVSSSALRATVRRSTAPSRVRH
jgi:hypothetical protein